MIASAQLSALCIVPCAGDPLFFDCSNCSGDNRGGVLGSHALRSVVLVYRPALRFSLPVGDARMVE